MSTASSHCIGSLTSQALVKNISKCYLTLSWEMERKQRHGRSCSAVCPPRPAPPLFIAYVKACVRMSDPCNEGLEARAAEKADSLGTRGFYRPAIFPHSLRKA